MNRPSQLYTYLADKHYDSNFKILWTFAKEVIKELGANPEGVQLPLAFLQIKRVNGNSTNETLKRKYGEDYVMPNSHTDGEIITTKAIFKSDVYNNKNYSIRHPWLFKMYWGKRLKRMQYNLSKSGEYLNFKKHDRRKYYIKVEE